MKTPAQQLRIILNETLAKLINNEIATDTATSISRLADSQTRIAISELRAAKQDHNCDFFFETHQD
jgi:DNA invertase Pin-like site-specific DNA recombinase